MSESCNSRQFSWLVKSCFPNPQQDIHHNHRVVTTSLHSTTAGKASTEDQSISSLPHDLLLECLSRVAHSSLFSISLVCRRWAHLLHSSDFYQLRRCHGRLRHTVFAVAVTDSALHTASHRIGHDASWKMASFTAEDVLCFHHLFSHARLSAIGRHIYIIGRTAMLRCDTWTGTVTARSGMIFPRKKFAAAVVYGKIYVSGGASRSSAVEEYDPETDTWLTVADAPRRRYGCIGASVDGVFYVIGGLKIGSSGNENSRAAGAEAHVYASSMDLYDVEARGWLRSRSVPGGGCVVAACAAEGHIYVLASHAVELSFWRFGARKKSGGGGFGEWCRVKSPPLPAQFRLDSTVRFSCVGVGDKVALVQVMGCIDDLLRRGGRSTRGLKEGLVLVYDCAAGEWSREADLPEVIRRAACVSVEC
ncbi:F-box/kelch-repeat protein At5g26960 [Cornus florida]|uniref:F-box/kelch-repeat protein At5g26960 n=1 Tax=Cornus florida TaxID=4283 RepID=UPI0028A12C52|nr:F-box/kelch-repeat protein At5g26960 [Cornus florida]